MGSGIHTNGRLLEQGIARLGILERGGNTGMPLTAVEGMASIPVGLPHGGQKIRALGLSSPR